MKNQDGNKHKRQAQRAADDADCGGHPIWGMFGAVDGFWGTAGLGEVSGFDWLREELRRSIRASAASARAGWISDGVWDSDVVVHRVSAAVAFWLHPA